VSRDGRAHDFAKEAGPKDSFQRAAGVVRAEAEQKSGIDPMTRK
jgi:hypothetical protein